MTRKTDYKPFPGTYVSLDDFDPVDGFGRTRVPTTTTTTSYEPLKSELKAANAALSQAQVRLRQQVTQLREQADKIENLEKITASELVLAKRLKLKMRSQYGSTEADILRDFLEWLITEQNAKFTEQPSDIENLDQLFSGLQVEQERSVDMDQLVEDYLKTETE